MSDNNGSQGKDLEESMRQDNSNLQRLIEAIGGLLAASAELLGRLQQILSRGQPADAGGLAPPHPPDQPTQTDRLEC